MNPNSVQALQNQQAGVQEEEEDVDYDALYGGLDVDVNPEEKSPELQHSYLEIFGDVAKQGIKETLIGAGGTWGDLAELAGVNKQTEFSKQRNSRDNEILERMNKPGYKPSFEDIDALSGEDDIIPSSFQLPTSQNLRDVNEAIGGPGEAETGPGRYAARTGRLYGSGLAMGQLNPLPALAAGGVGQSVEELGGGPLAQTAAEIITLIGTQGRSGKNLLNSSKKEVQDKINKLRQLGYTEEDITLAINSASKGKKGGVNASKSAKTEKAFENFAEKSDDIVEGILSSEIPGVEKGISKVHEMASDAYGQVAKEGANLTITNSKPFLDASKRVVDELQRNLGKNPEAQAFIKRISEAAMDSTQYPSAESFMNFYKELNSMGKWIGRSQRDRLITQVKDGIKDTFKGQGKAGKEFADKFEKVNKGIRKAYQAEDAVTLIDKARTQNGLDYNKLNKLFDKKDNIQLFEDVLGAKQTENLQMIAKTGKEVKDFDKAWKVVNNGESSILGAYYLFKGDWSGLAKLATSKVGGAAAKRLAEKSLTDPKFQNLMIKGLHSIKNSSPKSFASVKESMRKYLEEEGIDIDLD